MMTTIILILRRIGVVLIMTVVVYGDYSYSYSDYSDYFDYSYCYGFSSSSKLFFLL